MAVQIIPLVKALAPYLAQVATAAIPAFTSKTGATTVEPVVAKQIEELQVAATQNAQSIHLLAEKMQQAIEGIEAAAQDARKQVATYKLLLYVSLGLSLTSLCACLYLLSR